MRGVEYASASDFRSLKRQMERVEKEVRELKAAAIPVVELSPEEHEELDKIEAEMESGKEKNWRQISGK